MNVKNISSGPGKPQFHDFFEQLRELLAEPRGREDGVKQLGEKEIDGRRLSVSAARSPCNRQSCGATRPLGCRCWSSRCRLGIPHIEVTRMSRFFFNGHLDPALFETTPPADYKVQAFDLDLSKPTETALIEGLRVGADLNGGLFVDNLDSASDSALADSNAEEAIGDKQEKVQDMAPRTADDRPRDDVCRRAARIGRGPLRRQRGQAWRPESPDLLVQARRGKEYRVIYADLSVKDADRAPVVATLLAAPPLLASQESTFQAFNMFAEAIVEARSATFDMEVNIEGQEKQAAQKLLSRSRQNADTSQGDGHGLRHQGGQDRSFSATSRRRRS